MNFNQIEAILNGTVERALGFINCNKNYIGGMTKLDKDYAIEKNINFNIFTSLTNYYYRENMHSDILKLIFDPYTEKIGNIKYIELFKNFIEKRLNKEIDLNLRKVKIERKI
jgi:hypothetical protein